MFKKDDFIGMDKRYKVISVLGEGGMGMVLKAYDSSFKENVAIKVLHQKFSNSKKATSMFMNEANTCRKLTHRNIIKVYDANSFYFNNKKIYFMVMEYVKGGDLKEWLDRHNTIEERAARKMINIIKPILEALGYAHQYTIHRDMKPANIMIDLSVRKGRVVLMDFGIAKAMDESKYDNKTDIGAMGTRNYMSPEQMFNASDIDIRTDIYSMGVVLYEMLTLVKPINRGLGDPHLPSKYNHTVTHDLDILVLKMLSFKKEDRQNSLQEVIYTLDSILSNMTNVTEVTGFTILPESKNSTNQKNTKNTKKPQITEITEITEINEIYKKTILIEEGNFFRGSGIESKVESEKPKKQIYLKAFKIGKYAVSNEDYALFLRSTKYKKPKLFEFNYKNFPNRPVINVSWVDANKFCEWCKGSLPTEAQWEKAAAGPKNYIYPWGNKFDNSKSNIGYSLGEIVDVDKFPEGASGYGCLQMSGNIWEWCLDDYINDFYKKSNSENPVAKIVASNGEDNKVLRGGSFDFVGFSARVAYRYLENKHEKMENIGFRVVFN